MDTKDRMSRIAPLCGAVFVVLELAGVIIGSAGGRSMAALGDPQSKIVKSFHDPVGTGVWVGAYLELAALAAFAVFAIWMFRERRGALASAVVTTYVVTTIAALVARDALAFGSAHGLGDQALLALFYLQSGLFFATWGIAAAFLLLAPADGWMRRTAVAIAALLLIAMAFPTGGPSQFPNMLFLIWVLVASVKLARPLRRSILRPAWESSRAT
jgi:hypothetical protein